MSSRNSAVSRSASSRQSPPTFVGALEQRVVDVGDVLDVGDLVAGVAPRPQQQVEADVGRRVAEVGGVVRRDPADVEPGRTGVRRDVDEGAGRGVVEAHGRTDHVEVGELGGGPGTHAGRVAGALRTAATGWPASHRAGPGRPRCAAAARSGAAAASAPRRRAAPRAPRRRGRRAPRAAGRRRRARRRSSGSPAQPQSTVRSLGSGWKQTPWSTPYRWPSGISRTCPPLRSALLTSTSKTAIRRSGTESSWTRAIGWSCWSRPSKTWQVAGRVRPLGDHRDRLLLRVGLAPELHHAAAVRARRAGSSAARRPSRAPRRRRTPPARGSASVPSGKSHSGRSPATGL